MIVEKYEIESLHEDTLEVLKVGDNFRLFIRLVQRFINIQSNENKMNTNIHK